MPRASVMDRPWPKPGWGWVTCPVCGDKITNNARGRESHIKACLKKNQARWTARLAEQQDLDGRLYAAAKELSESCDIVYDEDGGSSTYSKEAKAKLDKVLAEYEKVLREFFKEETK